MGLVYLLGQIPFGQVLETTTEKRLSIYYKLGGLKFKHKTLDRLESVTLEQDKNKYYCLILKIANGQSLTIEKYPTLDEANERLFEFKKTLC